MTSEVPQSRLDDGQNTFSEDNKISPWMPPFRRINTFERRGLQASNHSKDGSSKGRALNTTEKKGDESSADGALDDHPFSLPPQLLLPSIPVPLASRPPILRQPMLLPPRRMNKFDRRRQPGPPPMRPSDNRNRGDDEDDQYGDTEEEENDEDDEEEEEEEEQQQHPRRQLSRPRMNGPNSHRRSSSSSFTRGAPAEIWRPPPPASQPSGLSRTFQHAINPAYHSSPTQYQPSRRGSISSTGTGVGAVVGMSLSRAGSVNSEHPRHPERPSEPYGGSSIERDRVYGPVPEPSWTGFPRARGEERVSQALAAERQPSSSPRAISRVDERYPTASPALGTSPRRADTLPYIPSSASARAIPERRRYAADDSSTRFPISTSPGARQRVSTRRSFTTDDAPARAPLSSSPSLRYQFPPAFRRSPDDARAIGIPRPRFQGDGRRTSWTGGSLRSRSSYQDFNMRGDSARRPAPNEASNGEEEDDFVDDLELDRHSMQSMRSDKSMRNIQSVELEREVVKRTAAWLKQLEAEARQLDEESAGRRMKAETRQKEEEARWRNVEMRRKEEQARQKEEEVRRKVAEFRRLEARRNEEKVAWKEEEVRWIDEDMKREEKDPKRLIGEEVAEGLEEAEKMRKEVRRLVEEKQRLKEELKQMAQEAMLKKVEARQMEKIARKEEEAARNEQRLQTTNPRLPHYSHSPHQLHSLPLDANLHTSDTVKTSRMPEVSWRSIFNLQHPASQPSIQHLGRELSKEQTMRIGDARKRVVRATQSVLGKVIDIAHDALTIGTDLLDYVPIPGLAPAAHALLDIWDAFEQVQSNRFACLRLVERCASILISVREEVVDAGHVVSENLKRPIIKLHESFADVLGLLQRQLDMPFLKRFVGRSRILQDIEHCDASLTEALWRLGFSVQIQTMKLLQASQANGFNTFGAWKQRFTSKSKVHSSLEKLCRQQDLEDQEQDFAELRQLLRAAVETTDDVELVEILEIGRDEMPEAMRTLEHTLNNYNPLRSTEHPNSDDLDRRFMENGIEALRRLTSRQGAPVDLPSWTISRFEINLDRRIGIGLFSNVYKGTWQDRVVAIKMLADATPQKLFVREADIWKSLSHPNIVQLLGASSTSSDPPWFFVSPYYKNGNLVKYLKDISTLKAILALRMMYEISSGMAYLHKHGVLHGDLKAVNVLVDDGDRCIITDFGQSELKSEVYRVTRQPIARGTLRWQAPELMRGTSVLTQQADVYAFAITCIEIITKGSLPWNMQDDSDVRHAVLVRRERPSLLSSSFPVDKKLRGLLYACCHQDPSSRPPFSRISNGFANLRRISTGLTTSQSI